MKTHAEFRVLRESLGISQPDVARAMGVQERSARRWEQPGFPLPPDDAWEWLEDMRAVFEKGVAAALQQVADIAEAAGEPPTAIAMTYYRTQQEYDELGRDRGPYGFRNAMTREVAARLREKGFDVVIGFLGEGNSMVLNEWGDEISFEAAVNIMDDELREQVHADMAPCTDQEFFNEYTKRHLEKFGEEFEPNKENPCW